MFLPKKPRREIRKWSRHHIASVDYVCERCDTPIMASTYYCRRIFVNFKRLDVEREHAKPDCPSRYM